MKIAFFSTQSYDKEFFNRNNTGHFISYYESLLNEGTTKLAKDHEAVCVFVNDKLNKTVILQLKEAGIKLIALRCAGYNNVDVATAKESGIAVVRVPAYSPHAVAEHAVALILTLNRKTHKAYNRVREGNFSLEKLTGFDLYGKTVGIIGTGRIGSAFAEIMMGFGCRLLLFDVSKDVGLEKKGASYVSLTELLKQSDIISLHCPLTEKTRHLINGETLGVIKKGAMLINTGRGALIDTTAVIRALKKGQLGYLGMDVYEQEEQLFFRDLSESIIQDDQIMRLMTFPNVLITAHQAFFTEEALDQIARVTLQNISDFEAGKTLTNAIQ